MSLPWNIGATSWSCASNRGWSYPLPVPWSNRMCCAANSVGLDTTGWYRVDVLSISVDAQTDMVLLRFSLSFKDVFTDSWRRLLWSQLSSMHGRHIHVSAVAHDLSAAWHVHPAEADLRREDTEFVVQLKMQPARECAGGASDSESGQQTVHMLFSFGILADDVGLCVDETASHVDPAPGGQVLVVEGQATARVSLPCTTSHSSSVSDTATATAASHVSGGYGDWRTSSTLRLGGEGADDIVGGAPITSALEAACTAESEGGAAGARCLTAKLSGGELWPGYRALPARLEQLRRADRLRGDGEERWSSALNATLFSDSAVARSSLGASSGGAVGAGGASSSHYGGPIPYHSKAALPAAFLSSTRFFPACLGLNVFVWKEGAKSSGSAPFLVPATGAFEPYLTMAAHGIIASVPEDGGASNEASGEQSMQLWHIHLAMPSAFKYGIDNAQPVPTTHPTFCAMRMEGMGSEQSGGSQGEHQARAGFGPSLLGLSLIHI